MNYCNNCGNTLRLGTPPGDDRQRHLCATCGTIHYENPKVVVGCIPESDEKILLCRRAIENGETVAQGAQRETLEEAGAQIEIIAPYALFNITYVSQIYVMFRARLLGGHFEAGSESIEVGLFSEKDIPWDEIAFTVIEATLRQYYKDRPTGKFPCYMGDILPHTRQKAGEY